MRQAGMLAVVGGFLMVGVVASSYYFQWWPIGYALSQRQLSPALSKNLPETDRERLLTRVTEYWQARTQGDQRVAFQYEHPVQQKRLGEQTYRKKIGSTLKVHEFTVLDLQLEPDAEVADVKLGVKYEYDFRLPRAQPMIVPTRFTDYWQKEQGVWYHVLDLKVLSDGRPVTRKKS